MGDNLKEKTINALKWSTVDRFGQQAVQFVIGITLAHLLTPEDYALVGMLALFYALSFVLVESGFGQSLVRKQAVDEKEFSAIFYFNAFIGIFIYAVLFFCAPLIAAFFNQPQLVSLARVSFLAIPLNALYLMQFVKLGIKLDYKSIAKVNLIATAISGSIGITVAVSGRGVWALVWQMVAYHFFRLVCFVFIVRWKPLRDFSFGVIREHWKYSVNLLGTGTLNVVFNNIFLLVFGKYFPLKETGYYNQANKQAETVNFTFVSVLTGSTYNIFSRIQNDVERLQRVLREFIHKVAIIVIPSGFFLIGSAPNLIVTLIGNQWLPAVPYFQLICAANLAAPLYLLNINSLNARGLSGITFRTEIIKKGLILLSIITLFQFGGKVMIAGYVIACWLAYGITMVETKKTLKYYWSHQVKDILPAAGIGLVIGMVVFGISQLQLNNVFLLIIELIAAGVIYVASVKILYKDLFEKVLAQVKSYIYSVRN